MSSKIINLSLAVALVVLPVGLTHGSTLGHAHAEESHQHHGTNEAMQLNNGDRWETDAPLRQAMAKLRGDIRPLMQEIHQNNLAAEGYDALALSVQDQVTYMIQNCELEGDADAQLHLVIAQLLAGADAMKGETQDQPRRDGAVQVVGALNDYATYFEDPTFEKLQH